MIELLMLGALMGTVGKKVYNEPKDPQLRKQIRKINARNQGFAPRKK